MMNGAFELQDCETQMLDLLEMRKKIMDLLFHLGITARYVGYAYLRDALERLIFDGEDVSLLTKHLLPEVARKYGTSWQTVERGIRAVIDASWEQHAEYLETILGRKLNRRPTIKEFLFDLREYLVLDNVH